MKYVLMKKCCQYIYIYIYIYICVYMCVCVCVCQFEDCMLHMKLGVTDFKIS